MEPTDRHPRMAPRTQEKVPLPSPVSILWDRVPGPKSRCRSQSRSHAETQRQPKPLWGGAASLHPGPWALHCRCLGCRGDSSRSQLAARRHVLTPAPAESQGQALQLLRSRAGAVLDQAASGTPRPGLRSPSLSPREWSSVPRRFCHPPQSHLYPSHQRSWKSGPWSPSLLHQSHET